jgi:GT2 family glycosyltransferase
VDVTVVTVTHNSAPLLQQHLSSLTDALQGIDRYEIVVVDSGSADKSLEAARRLAPQARLVSLGENSGYAAGINSGIAAGSLRGCVVVLNPDTIPSRCSLATLARALDIPGTGISVPRLVDNQGHVQHCLRRRPTVLRALGEAVCGGRAGRFEHLGETIQDPIRYECGSIVDWAGGAAMAISRACLDAVGDWDESFFLYSEETDFALRAGDFGFSTRYVPEAVVMHQGGDSHVSPLLFTLLTVNRVRLYRRRAGRLRGAGYWGAVVVNCALRAGVGSREHLSALRSLFRPANEVVADIRRVLAA